jgi:hypothetical protein
MSDSELDDDEPDAEFGLEPSEALGTEMDSESDYESADDHIEGEVDLDVDSELDELDGAASEYGERFCELSERDFEEPGSLDAALDEVLQEMGRQYFFKRAWRGLKKRASLKRLVGAGLKLARNAGVKIPALSALKNMSGLAQSILQGNLSGIAKNALAAALKVHPTTAAAMPALSALGFESGQDDSERRQAWHNFAEVSRESFEYLADNLNETAHQPAQAVQLAGRALQHGLQSVARRGRRLTSVGARGRRKLRVVRLEPGERLLVIQSRHKV